MRGAVGWSVMLCLTLQGCGQQQVPLTPHAVTIAWAPAPENTVNQAGGGYRLYYAAGLVTAGTVGILAADVPYAGGASTPTQATVTLPGGVDSVWVVAYGALPGDVTQTSAPSQPLLVPVP